MSDNHNNKTTIVLAVITLIGGTITAVIANWDKLSSGPESKTTVVPIVNKVQPEPKQEFGKRKYSGNVGKWPTIYELQWNENGSIEGYYQYFERKTNDIFELRGRKINESMIELKEFINGSETATALLIKRDNCYSGKIKNKDYINNGRILDMSICE